MCTLILCEGDSAKAGIVSGLSKEDRKFIGVFPLKGKLRNVYGLTIKNVSTNKEISNIKKIMGLKFNTVLFDNMSIKNLRAGVKLAKKYYETEASGNIRLKKVK